MSDDPQDLGPRHSAEPPQTQEERIAQGPAANVEPPGGMATSAGGSDKQSSGGTGDGEHAAGEDPETDWLRRVNEGETPSPVESND